MYSSVDKGTFELTKNIVISNEANGGRGNLQHWYYINYLRNLILEKIILNKTFNLKLSIVNIAKKLVFSIVISGMASIGFSQQLYLPLGNHSIYNYELYLNSKANLVHTSSQPFLESDFNMDSILDLEQTRNQFKHYQRIFPRKVKYESLIQIDTGQFSLSIDPLMNFEAGIERTNLNNRLLKNTRGVRVQGSIGKKVSFMSSLYENQATFPEYQREFIVTTGAVPGKGRTKTFKEEGFDYAMTSGYISYTPIKQLNIQFGHDKQFIGDGYRSLLLSDNSFNYPFLKLRTLLLGGKLLYSSTYAGMQSLDRIPEHSTPEASFQRKAATFHYFSIIPFNWLQIGVFEGTIWQRWDSLGTTSFNGAFLFPVIGINSITYGLNNLRSNSVLGFNLKLNITNSMLIYGQLMIDDLKTERMGYQFGAKYFDVFKIKNLYGQLEYNTVNKHTYSSDVVLQNYGHYNQAIAHPLGAGFSEAIGILKYNFKDFFINMKMNYINRATDNTLFIPYSDAVNLPESISTITLQSAELGYMINRKSRLNIVIGALNRKEVKINETKITRYGYIALRTSLINQYFDF